MDIVELIFSKYWNQILLLILAIAYFVKRLFDNLSKRKEINHSLFQNKKLECANSFFLCYSKAEQMWEHLKINQILRNEFSASEIDDMIFPTLNELRSKVFEMQIYVEEEDYKLFNNIFKNFLLINNKLSEMFFTHVESLSVTRKANEFHIIKDDVMLQNKYFLRQICTSLKNDFG